MSYCLRLSRSCCPGLGAWSPYTRGAGWWGRHRNGALGSRAGSTPRPGPGDVSPADHLDQRLLQADRELAGDVGLDGARPAWIVGPLHVVGVHAVGHLQVDVGDAGGHQRLHDLVVLGGVDRASQDPPGLPDPDALSSWNAHAFSSALRLSSWARHLAASISICDQRPPVLASSAP